MELKQLQLKNAQKHTHFQDEVGWSQFHQFIPAMSTNMPMWYVATPVYKWHDFHFPPCSDEGH